MRVIDADAILKADENSDKVLVLGSGKSLEIAYALLKKKVEDAPTFAAAVAPKHIVSDLHIHMSFSICTEWTPTM